MISLRQRKAFKAIAVFVAFSFAQVCVQTGLAVPGPSGGPLPVPQQFSARLTTKGNQPITVNGASAASGAMVLTGATFETPDQVSASIDLGARGTVDLEPNSNILLDFFEDIVRVKLIRGCAVITKKGPGDAEMYTAEGASGKVSPIMAGTQETPTEKTRRWGMAFCYVDGQLNPFLPVISGGGKASGGSKHRGQKSRLRRQ